MRVLDDIRESIVVVDKEGRLRFANAAGARLLAAGVPLSFREGRLRCHDDTGNSLLRRTIEQVCSSDHPQAQGLMLSRPGRHPLLLTIKRLGGTGSDCLALLLALDAHPEPNALSNALQSYFGLTRSEAEVAVGIAEGRAVAAIAGQRQVAVETVRTQLKRIATKLGCARQSQIAAIVNAVPALASFPDWGKRWSSSRAPEANKITESKRHNPNG